MEVLTRVLSGWGILLAVIIVLGWIAFNFSRRTFRCAVLVTVVGFVIFATVRGLGRKYPGDYAQMFLRGAKSLSWRLVRPFPHKLVGPSVKAVGWIAAIVILILLGVVLALLDTWSARREQPRVTVPDAPKPEKGNSNIPIRRELTEKLRFCLPAVDVSRPAVMPGSSTLDSVASLAAESPVQGGGIAAALIRLFQSLQSNGRAYEVRMFVESGGPGGDRVTAEVRDANSGRSIGVKVIQPCTEGVAAEKVAGYTARQVFLTDPSTPYWAVGSADGGDLSAYLLARQISPANWTKQAWQECRRQQQEKLESAVRNNSGGAGVVGYELANIYDLDGDHLRSLLMHLRNRVRCPTFWRGRNRLAISLSMLAVDPVFQRHWQAESCKHPAKRQLKECVKCNVRLEMSNAGMLRRRDNREALHGNDPKEAKLAFLRLARREYHACRWRKRAFVLLWIAFWHRGRRAECLAALRSKPSWLLHPRRRLRTLAIGLAIIKQRERRLNDSKYADTSLNKAQKRVLRRIGLRDAERPEQAGPPADARIPDTSKKDRRWNYRRAPWQTVYNAACMYALPETDADQADLKKAKIAVRLLQLAVSDPACELDRPSEWIDRDPGLLSLHQDKKFEDFVATQEKVDFDPAEGAFRRALRIFTRKRPHGPD